MILSILIGICDLIAIILLSVELKPNNDRSLVNYPDEKVANNYSSIRICLIIHLTGIIMLNLTMLSIIQGPFIKILGFIVNIIVLFLSLLVIVLALYTHSHYIENTTIEDNPQYQATLSMILIPGCIGAILGGAKCYH
jgi:hypothetical protein